MSLDLVLAIGAIALGWVIFGCVCSYAIPQFVRIIRSKNTSAMTIVGYVAFIICAALMGSWGIGNAIRTMVETPQWSTLAWLSLIPNILTNALNVTVNAIALIIKIHHLHLCKQYNINEIQLANRLVKAKKARGK